MSGWGEITALTRRDIDLATGTVSVRTAYVERPTGALELGPPKSRASVRPVVLPLPVVELLRAHLAAYVGDDPDALVFTGPSGRPLRRSNFNKQVRWDQARRPWACRTCTCTIFGILATPWPPATWWKGWGTTPCAPP